MKRLILSLLIIVAVPLYAVEIIAIHTRADTSLTHIELSSGERSALLIRRGFGSVGTLGTIAPDKQTIL